LEVDVGGFITIGDNPPIFILELNNLYRASAVLVRGIYRGRFGAARMREIKQVSSTIVNNNIRVVSHNPVMFSGSGFLQEVSGNSLPRK
jgi:hypothetical protein